MLRSHGLSHTNLMQSCSRCPWHDCLIERRSHHSIGLLLSPGIGRLPCLGSSLSPLVPCRLRRIPGMLLGLDLGPRLCWGLGLTPGLLLVRSLGCPEGLPWRAVLAGPLQVALVLLGLHLPYNVYKSLDILVCERSKMHTQTTRTFGLLRKVAGKLACMHVYISFYANLFAQVLSLQAFRHKENCSQCCTPLPSSSQPKVAVTETSQIAQKMKMPTKPYSTYCGRWQAAHAFSVNCIV